MRPALPEDGLGVAVGAPCGGAVLAREGWALRDELAGQRAAAVHHERRASLVVGAHVEIESKV